MPIGLHHRIPKDMNIRCHLQPGDIGYIIYLHGLSYGKEYGYDHTFEAYVAAGLGEFAQSFQPNKDGLWVAEMEGQMIGSIGIVRRSESAAQLRWFLVHPQKRGLGIGRALLHSALQFCKECKYETIFLWTISDLTIATHLYKSAGFTKTEEKTHKLWGKILTEERYDLHLRADVLGGC